MGLDQRILASMKDRLEWHDVLGSTNDRARALVARHGKDAHGWVVGADRQLAGRGRKGSEWFSEPGMGLTFSIIVTPDWVRHRWGWLSLTAGLAVCEVVEGLGLSPQIKWPNDVLIDNRKLCGILIETIDDAAVIGMGLNVNERSFPAELNAVSLYQILGEETAREVLVSEIWSVLMKHLQGAVAAISEQAWGRLAWRDREIETSSGVRGFIRGFGENAQLNVESADRLIEILDADGLRLADEAG